jgi:glycosyltransferase involved in cell wall biosynthesis
MPSVELSMIVKNGGGTLARCLESAPNAVDEIIVGDTGSNNNSIEIAGRCGARVIKVPWENDFSKARNRVLNQGKADWVLFLDADEMLDPGARKVISQLITARMCGGFRSKYGTTSAL